MIAIAFLFVRTLCDCFKPRWRLEAEILVLRHQLNVLQQRAPRRLHLHWADRALFIWLYRCCPRILDAITIVRPETVVRWHRMGFAAYWRWKSRSPGGRPRIGKEVRDLIRRMSFENPLWGAPRIHGELLRLGFDVAQSTVSIYMVPRRDRPSQTWKTFLRNHAEGIASIDLFVVPTISFEQQLYALLVLHHRRRRLLWTTVMPRGNQGEKPCCLTEECSHENWQQRFQPFTADAIRGFPQQQDCFPNRVTVNTAAGPQSMARARAPASQNAQRACGDTRHRDEFVENAAPLDPPHLRIAPR